LQIKPALGRTVINGPALRQYYISIFLKNCYRYPLTIFLAPHSRRPAEYNHATLYVSTGMSSAAQQSTGNADTGIAFTDAQQTSLRP